MTDAEGLRAAAAAGFPGPGDEHRALLTAIVEVARAIFVAKASSILLLDEETGELVFEAVAGEGEEKLLGMRFPAGTGIAGGSLRPGSRSCSRTSGTIRASHAASPSAPATCRRG